MARWTQLKLALVVMGLALFLSGIRLEHAALRTAGIVIIAVAFVLRFVTRPAPRDRPSADDEPSPPDSA